MSGTQSSTKQPSNYAEAITAAEKQIADNLPGLIALLVELAKGVVVPQVINKEPRVYSRPPDRQAAQYLINRIMGQTTINPELTGPDLYANMPDYETMIKMPPEDLIRLHQQLIGDL